MSARAPGKERAVPNTRDLAAETYNRIVARRVRKRLDPEQGPVTDEQTRTRLENRMADLEKIHGQADFLPVRFLADGVARAQAVCRITTAGSWGTGFLIGRGLIMTNNHVLEDDVTAAGSVAEFNFEEGATTVVVKLEPERLFITDAELDFTVVACDDTPVAEVTPVRLLRNPATVMAGERVSIIQHPLGEVKQIALHDSDVIAVKDKVIHYRTDTQPGSSGSPVFNKEWQLVALHHAGWAEGGGKATNEGVRISSIVARLQQMQFDGLLDGESVSGMVSEADGPSPYLGFFGLSGLVDGESDPREVQVDGFAGTRRFADLGFWNIEHFNGDVSDNRIRRVADVTAGMVMDVLGLVEVEQGALERLTLELGRRGLSYGYKVSDSPGRQDLAVLYDEDTTTVRMRPDLVKKHGAKLARKTASGRSAFPRLPLIAECTVGEGDKAGAVSFLMIVVHLKAFGDAESRARRRLAAQILQEVIKDVRESEGLAVVLGGDFNDTLDNDTFDALMDSPDLVTLTTDDAEDPTAISFVGQRYRSLIDHIVVSDDAVMGEIQGDDAAIVRLDRSIRDFSASVSDHVPVVMRLVFRDRELAVPAVQVTVPAAVAAGAAATGIAAADAARDIAPGDGQPGEAERRAALELAEMPRSSRARRQSSRSS